MTKDELRKQIKQRLSEQRLDDLSRWSDDICRALLMSPDVLFADAIFAFWPMDSEPDIRPALRQLFCSGKKILLPRVTSINTMEFCTYEDDESLRQMPPYGILEPTTRRYTPQPAAERSVMLVPGVAFTNKGHRLGHGRGYYDRFLARYRMKTIGICFPFQIVEEVPTDQYDITINQLIWKTLR